MRVKKSAESSRAEIFLAARADLTASIVQFVDICVVAYTFGHDISCPYPFASVHPARNGPLQKGALQQRTRSRSKLRHYKFKNGRRQDAGVTKCSTSALDHFRDAEKGRLGVGRVF